MFSIKKGQKGATSRLWRGRVPDGFADGQCDDFGVKTTLYFQTTRRRSDRAWIQDAWIERTVRQPQKEEIQADGRIRRWRRIPEARDLVLRVILLPDGETVHNAFFDRNIVL